MPGFHAKSNSEQLVESKGFMVENNRNAGLWGECDLQIPTYSKATSTFFGRNDSMAESFKDADLGHAPMEERRAAARDWLRRWTSASCSASTMTRASCSVPE